MVRPVFKSPNRSSRGGWDRNHWVVGFSSPSVYSVYVGVSWRPKHKTNTFEGHSLLVSPGRPSLPVPKGCGEVRCPRRRSLRVRGDLTSRPNLRFDHPVLLGWDRLERPTEKVNKRSSLFF